MALLGMLMGGASSYYSSSADTVRQKTHEANIKRIEGAARIYRLDVGSWPVGVEDLRVEPPGAENWRGPYLWEAPVNPWDPSRMYELDASGRVK